MKVSRRSLGRGSTLILVLVALLTFAAILSSCNPPSTEWDDFQGVNLMGVSTLEDFFFQGGLLAGTTDPVTNETAPTDYVRWEAVSTVSPPDGVDTPVYRYEVVNLFPNGDFEQGTLADTGWVDITDDIYSSQAELTSTALAGDRSLKLTFETSSVRYAIDLKEALADQFVTNGEYSFHYLIKTETQTLGNEVNDNTSEPYPQGIFQVNRGNDPNKVYEIPTPGATLTNDPGVVFPESIIVANANYTWFSFGGFSRKAQPNAIRATIDDFRIVRADRGHYARLSIPLEDATRPTLIQQGTYIVSVWVRSDPTAGSDNRFTPGFISLGIDSRPGEAGGEMVNRVDLGDTSVWTQYSTQIPGFDFPSVNVPGSTIILELLIEIGDSQSGPAFAIPGSLVMAGPSLQWSP